MTLFDDIVIIHDGQLSHDVAQQLIAKRPAAIPVEGDESVLNVEFRSASKSPKKWLEQDMTTTTTTTSTTTTTTGNNQRNKLYCFILQTIENAAPTEEGGTTVRFFQRKTHPHDLLSPKSNNDDEDDDENNSKERLNYFSYTVLGLGDSNLLLDRQTTTAKDCNQVAQQLDQRLMELGGKRWYELGLADERSELVEVEPWITGFWTQFVAEQPKP